MEALDHYLIMETKACYQKLDKIKKELARTEALAGTLLYQNTELNQELESLEEDVDQKDRRIQYLEEQIYVMRTRLLSKEMSQYSSRRIPESLRAHATLDYGTDSE